MAKNKWYLNSWLIVILMVFWPTIITAIIGIILLILQTINNKKLKEEYTKALGAYHSAEELERATESIRNDYEKKKSDLNNEIELLKAETESKKIDIKKSFDSEKHNLNNDINELKNELSLLQDKCKTSHYDVSDYDALTSEDCKNQLSMLKIKEKDLSNANEDIIVHTSTDSKKEINDNVKQIIRCFNSECDNIILNLSVKNIDTSRNKVVKSFETLNKIFKIDNVEISKKLLEIKLEELNLVYTYQLKREQEKELQRSIKEQMIEEEKVRREIEKEKAKIEKEENQFKNEISKLMKYLQTSSEIEKQLYVDKIKELEERLKAVEKDKENVLQREQNTRAGYVYVISNIGSFGEDVYKIGMTRRLEPLDRIKELSSASVPFEFDVHAMIFSEDAPALENTLHKYFEKQSVNRVNLKKEFFRVDIDEIEKVVKKNFNGTAKFTKVPVAAEYYETLKILNNETA